MAPITLKNLTKSFPEGDAPALQGLSMSFKPHSVTGVVGPDGAGKTTLLRLIAGLYIPTHGTVTVAGFDTVKEAENLYEFIGYMPQKFGLYEDLSIIENLRLYADLKNLTGPHRKMMMDKLLTITNLAPFTGRLARNLSGGMKQKLGLACALLTRPKVLLLDEPSVGVDPISRQELWDLVHEFREEGMTILWSTAYLDEAQQCDEVILLNEGELLFKGPPNDILKDVKGRVFLSDDIVGDRRKKLQSYLKTGHFIDGVIQAKAIRLVGKKGFKPGKELKKAAPCFEDAFIDKLGGMHHTTSILADVIKEKQGSGTVIQAKNLTRKFGDFVAANEIELDVQRGEIYGLLGPNGAGKSTTFKMLCGLLKPTSGHCKVLGVDMLKAAPKARMRIGYMAQKFSLYGQLDAKQNLDFFSGIYGLTGKCQKERVEEMIALFELERYLDVPAETLPLGYKQRLALSCSLMHRPEILFLDEPTSGVDPLTRREFWLHINAMVQKGVTVMVTTHFMDEAEYCDRIGLVYKGQLIARGSPDDLKESVSVKNPTLEDAFISLIKSHDLSEENGV